MIGLALAAGLLIGCPEPGPRDRRAHLPSRISVTVQFADGGVGSILVELGDPRDPPRVCYSEGVALFDGRRVLSMDGVGATTATDVVTGEVTGHQLATQHEMGASGPGSGFAMTLTDGTLRLGLPEQDAAVDLLEGVQQILALEWLAEADLSEEALEAAHRTFKAVSVLHPRPAEAQIDGDLSEWRSDRAMPVDDRAHIQRGEALWDGPRDTSFGVAARAHDQRLALAVRIRDETLITGDAVELELVGRTLSIPVRTSPGPCEGGLPADWECIFTDRVDFGTGLEIGLPLSALLAEPRRDNRGLPLVIRYHDVDGAEPPTVMASAPGLRSVQVSALTIW